MAQARLNCFNSFSFFNRLGELQKANKFKQTAIFMKNKRSGKSQAHNLSINVPEEAG